VVEVVGEGPEPAVHGGLAKVSKAARAEEEEEAVHGRGSGRPL
jgi:hypothetical protein